jgi:hypothetical protein
MRFKDYFYSYNELREANAGVMDNPHVQKLGALLFFQWNNVLNNFSNDTTPINSLYSNEELSNLNIPSGRTEYSINGITYNFQTYIVFDIEATSKHYDITGGVVNFNQNRTRPIKKGNGYLIDNLAFISKNLLHTYIRNIDKQAEGITINLKLNPYYSFADYKKLNNLVESIAYHEASHLYDIMVGIRKGESDNKDYHLSPIELRAHIASIAIELKKFKELGYNFSDSLYSSIGWINYKKKIKELSDYNANNKDQNISYVKKINKMRSKLAHYWNNNLK